LLYRLVLVPIVFHLLDARDWVEVIRQAVRAEHELGLQFLHPVFGFLDCRICLQTDRLEDILKRLVSFWTPPIDQGSHFQVANGLLLRKAFLLFEHFDLDLLTDGGITCIDSQIDTELTVRECVVQVLACVVKQQVVPCRTFFFLRIPFTEEAAVGFDFLYNCQVHWAVHCKAFNHMLLVECFPEQALRANQLVLTQLGS